MQERREQLRREAAEERLEDQEERMEEKRARREMQRFMRQQQLQLMGQPNTYHGIGGPLAASAATPWTALPYFQPTP